jgi:isopentenyldiphosphate isomerase/intracellular septation protein A
MRRQQVLLSFLPGFAPILAYILIDAFLGERAGLIAGVALGVGECVVIAVRERRLDFFTLLDTVFLVAMGAVSWALSNPVFFRIKPAISGGIFGLLFMVGSLGPHRFFLPYVQDKMNMGELPEALAKRTLAMIAGFGILTIAHSALTAVAALFWPKAVWSFVAGALFWILALAYMAAWTIPAFVASRPRGRRVPAEAEETLPIVDEEGRVQGRALRSRCHSGDGDTALLHPVVRLWLADGKGGFWLQKRSMDKLVQPGRWDCAVGGHVSSGESLEAALAREALEEIGIEGTDQAKLAARYLWRTSLERELAFLFVMEYSGPGLKPNPLEVTETRVWSLPEIAAEMKKPASERAFTEMLCHELENVIRIEAKG